MRHANRRDANESAIATLLARFGPEPIDTSRVGSGFPDLVWPYQGLTALFEVKTEAGELSPSQQRFIDDWRGGPLFVVRTEDDVLRAVQTLERMERVRVPVRG